MNQFTMLIAISSVVLGFICGYLFTIVRLGNRFNEATDWISKSREYVRLFEIRSEFYLINFEEEFAIHAIAPIKTTMVFINTFLRSRHVKPVTLYFLKLIQFDEIINKIILLNLQSVRDGNAFGKFYSIATGEIIAGDVKEILQELIHGDTLAAIKNWKPGV